MDKIKFLLTHPSQLVFSLLGHYGQWIPSKLYIQLCYRMKMGRWPNLKHPTRFTEKIQWYKLYYHNPLLSKLVDKHEVYEYVRERIGDKYLIPEYGAWEHFADIKWDKLPKQFVLKETHNSGCLAVVKDKDTFDRESIRPSFERYLNLNYFWGGREWAYKNAHPRIQAQKYEPSLGNPDSVEYKLTCYNGRVKLITVCTGEAPSVNKSPDLKVRTRDRKNDHFDRDWNRLDFAAYCHGCGHDIPRPDFMDEMIEVSEKLAEGLPQVRVDLYVIDGHIYFGELTFYTWCGYIDFEPKSMDEEMGTWFELPEKML